MFENFVNLLTLHLFLQLQKNALLTLCSDRILQDVVIFNAFSQVEVGIYPGRQFIVEIYTSVADKTNAFCEIFS